MENKVLLQITELKQYFPIPKTGLLQRERQWVKANDGVTLTIYKGETLGLVGESGCGKSTLGRTLLQLYPPTGGTAVYYGRSRRALHPRYVRRSILALPHILQKSSNPDRSRQVLAQLFGGLVTARNLGAISQALLAEYDAERKLEALRGRTSPGSAAMMEAEAALARCAARVADLRAQCMGAPDFLALEALRDDGIHLEQLTSQELRPLRQDLQIVFQDPDSSLNPRMTAGQIVGEGPVAHGMFQRGDPALAHFVQQIMQECGLAPYLQNRYPHQFSGGQRQRVGIARALALRPSFLVCDEAVSALDVSIRAQILDLLLDLKEHRGLTYLFISHDLSVVRYLSDRIGVMYLGGLVELAPTGELFASPRHPYTQALLDAVPATGPGAGAPSVLLRGEVPSPVKPPSGCRFHTRCLRATSRCSTSVPAWTEVVPGHFVACHHMGVPLSPERAGD